MPVDSPRYTVIVPMAHFRPGERVLVSLRETPAPSRGEQVIVAVGVHPARQRNLAVAHARGDIVVFLDNDCALGEGFWARIDEAFARPEVEIAGGPALLRPGASAWEQIFHALLTHPLIVGGRGGTLLGVGKIPAREADRSHPLQPGGCGARSSHALGRSRATFTRTRRTSGSTARHAAGIGAYYDPALQVFRPQRRTPREMIVTLLRYGIGRTRQFRVSGWRFTFHQVLPFVLLGDARRARGARLELEFRRAVAARGGDHRGDVRGLAARLAADRGRPHCAGDSTRLLIGQLAGWIAVWFPVPVQSPEITLLDERGQAIF